MIHGTRSTYCNFGCRCDPCKAANSSYMSLYRTNRSEELRAYDRARGRAGRNQEKVARYHIKRAEALLYLGGQCAACGTDEDLQFDHIDPASKKHDMKYLFHSRKDGVILEELELCQLLCASCHGRKSLYEGPLSPNIQRRVNAAR